MILSGKFVFLVILGAIATWSFPAGIFLDAGILAAYAYIKRKRGPGGTGTGLGFGRGKAPAQGAADPGTGDLVKLVALSMLGKADPSLASKLAGIPGTGAGAPRPLSPAERAYRRSLVE